MESALPSKEGDGARLGPEESLHHGRDGYGAPQKGLVVPRVEAIVRKELDSTQEQFGDFERVLRLENSLFASLYNELGDHGGKAEHKDGEEPSM